MSKEYIKTYLQETAGIANLLNQEAIEKTLSILLDIKMQKGRIFFLGVGGGAGTGSHATNDFIKIAKIPTINLSDNVALLTALTNDEGWDSVFKRQLEMHNLSNKDCIFIYSVGGGSDTTSRNLVLAIDYAKKIGAKILGVVGKESGATAQKADACVIVPCLEEKRRTAHTEDFQMIVDHLLVNLIAEKESNEKNKAIFLDRDGVINEVIMREKKPASPRKLEELIILPEVAGVLKKFREMDFLNIIVSNQPDVSRGLLKAEELEKMNRTMEDQLSIDEIRNCTHDDKDNCNCRKPKPGMMLEAAEKWNIDLGKSFLIGDNRKDVEAGKAAGLKTFLIRKDYNKDLKEGYDFEIVNLKEAFQIIKKL